MNDWKLTRSLAIKKLNLFCNSTYISNRVSNIFNILSLRRGIKIRWKLNNNRNESDIKYARISSKFCIIKISEIIVRLSQKFLAIDWWVQMLMQTRINIIFLRIINIFRYLIWLRQSIANKFDVNFGNYRN